MSEPVLDIRDLSVDFGVGAAAVRALDRVTLSIGRGEIFGIAGESGSGKSTLLYTLTRLLPNNARVLSGQILYKARGGDIIEITSLEDERLRRLRWANIAIVTQAAMNALNPVMNVEAQIMDVLSAHGHRLKRQEGRARTAELLALVGITPDRLKAFPHELSGGMRQRVLIAMALALDPDVLILDEPTTALDVVTQRQIIEEVYAIRERLEISVIFVTHDLSLLLEIADVVAVMYAGKVVEVASREQFQRAPAHPYSDALLASFPTLDGGRSLKRLRGGPPDMRDLPRGCAFHPRCQFAQAVCRECEPALVRLISRAETPRLVACHLHDERMTMQREDARVLLVHGDA
jgi:peptide/nickel transport system ATP-binding protein